MRGRDLGPLADALLAFQHGERDEDGGWSERARLGAAWRAQVDVLIFDYFTQDRR